MNEVYVLWWKYSDGSSCGVCRVYFDKARAESDMKLLEDALTSKDYKLDIVPVFK